MKGSNTNGSMVFLCKALNCWKSLPAMSHRLGFLNQCKRDGSKCTPHVFIKSKWNASWKAMMTKGASAPTSLFDDAEANIPVCQTSPRLIAPWNQHLVSFQSMSRQHRQPSLTTKSQCWNCSKNIALENKFKQFSFFPSSQCFQLEIKQPKPTLHLVASVVTSSSLGVALHT